MKNVDPTDLSLKGRLGFLAKDSILYGGAGAFNKAFALIAFPILARHFSVAEYGTIDLFTTVIILLTMLAVFGQDSAVARYFYEYDDLESKKQVISQSFLFQFLGMLIFCPVLYWLSDSISPYISDSPKSSILFKLVLLQLPFMLVINFSQNILKWSFSRVPFLIVSIGSTVLSVLSLLLLVFFFSLQIEDVFKVYLLTRGIFGCADLWFVRNWLTWPKNFKLLRELCGFAFPLGLVCFIGSVMPMIERAIIFSRLGTHELGYYAVAVKISMFIVLPIQAFQMAWGPFSLSLFREEDAADTFNWVLKFFTLGILSFILLIAAASGPLIFYLASDRYMDSVIIVFPMLLALGIESIAWIAMVGIGFSKRSSFDLASCIVYVIVSTVISYILVRSFGFYGVAWGSLVGSVVRAIIGTSFAQRLHFINWSFSGVFILCTMVLSGGFVAQMAYLLWNHTVGACIFMLTFLAVLYPGSAILFSAAERRIISSAFSEAYVKFKGKRVIS